jgi:hypothetical protein
MSLRRAKLGRMHRNKRSTYERRIATLFAEWTGDIVKRTPLSGGWARVDFGVVGVAVGVAVGVGVAIVVGK